MFTKENLRQVFDHDRFSSRKPRPECISEETAKEYERALDRFQEALFDEMWHLIEATFELAESAWEKMEPRSYSEEDNKKMRKHFITFVMAEVNNSVKEMVSGLMAESVALYYDECKTCKNRQCPLAGGRGRRVPIE